MSDLVIRSAYDPRVRAGKSDFGPSRTKQADKDQADINRLVSRWMKSGTMPNYFNEANGQFLDVADVPDFRTAWDTVIQAQNLFGSLPSTVRERFGNDPANLFAFLNDASNREEAVKLGLLEPLKPAASAEALPIAGEGASPAGVAPVGSSEPSV